MAPGSKLPSEHQLAKRFGVSRSVVREAVSGLASRGMLERRQGAGTFVVDAPVSGFALFEIDCNNLADTAKLLEIRSGLDAAAARIAAVRRTAEQVQFLREMNAAAFREDLTTEQAVEADLAFHLAIVEATRNEHFLSVQRSLLAHLQRAILFTRTLESYSPEMVKEVKREHAAILKAIEAQDPKAASRRAEGHVLNALRRMRRALAQAIPDDVA